MSQTAAKKRQRSTRACGHCRRRKVRCDGTEPCAQCQTGDHECSYGELNRRMTSAVYIQSLENRVRELEALVGREPQRKNQLDSLDSGESFLSSMPLSNIPGQRAVLSAPSNAQSDAYASSEEVIETMVGAGEHSSANASSVKKYGGCFAGLSLLRRLQTLCKDFSMLQQNSDAEAVEENIIHAFDFTLPRSDSTIPWEAFALLPPKNQSDHAIDVVVNQACCNMQFLDEQNLYEMVRNIYTDTESDSFHHNRKPLALLYAVLALARRFDAQSPNTLAAAEQRTTRGLRYFRACRAMLDSADSHDLLSLQTLLCMVLYTQASSMMSMCHSYISLAVTVSLQMGLFTDAGIRDLPETERLCRRRISSVLDIMDTYVAVALGLPKMLRISAFPHTLPTLTKPAQMTDPLAGTYAHAQLIQILVTIIDSFLPINQPTRQQDGFYGVEHSKITAIEDQLEAWFAQLPHSPSAADTVDDANLMRSELLLRLEYAHVQIVLYRPFLHHALNYVRRSNDRTSLKAYACGSACIKASMQVVWLVERLEACNLFSEAHWFITLTIAFTAACLTLFVMSNDGDPTLHEIDDAARRLKNLCSRHANESVTMQQCYGLLELQFSSPLTSTLNN